MLVENDFLSFTASDGAVLKYFDEGSGTPVLLIAGYSASAQTWFYQKQALLTAGYRVIGWNPRFHGFSDRPAYGFRLSRLAADLKEFVDANGLSGKTVFVGQSMGAASLLCYVSLFGDEDMKALVTVDQTPQMLNTEIWPHGMYGFDKETMAFFFDRPIPNSLYAPLSDFVATEIARIATQEPEFDLELTKPLLLDHAYASWLDILPQIRVPSLFVAGKNSPFWPCEHAEQMSVRVPNGRTVVIDSCGHCVNWEKPDEFNTELLSFLDELGKS